MIKKYVAMVMIGSLVLGMTACKKTETPSEEAIATVETTVETIQTEETQAQAQTEETVAEQQAQAQAQTTTKAKAQAQAKATGTTKAQTQAKASGTQAKATGTTKAQAVAVATTTTKAKVAKQVPIYKTRSFYVCNQCKKRIDGSYREAMDCHGACHTETEKVITGYTTIYE